VNVKREPQGKDKAPPVRGAQGRRRIKQVFAFLKAFAERRAADVRTLDEVPRKLRLKQLPDHPAIKIGAVTLKPGGGRSRDEIDEEEARSAEPLIRVRRPTLTKAPPPPELVAEWVLRGWERPDGKIAVLELRNRRTRDGKISEERFESDPARPRALQAWSRLWKQWSASEKPAREAMRVFETLYALHGAVEREGERVELVLGDGRLVWRTAEGPIDHPVLLQRVDLVFDPDVPEFGVVDSDRPPELNGPLLLAGGTLSGEKLNELRQELETGGFHPLAGEETSTFLRRVVSRLGPAGVVKKELDEAAGHDGPVIVRDACLLARDRAAGFAAAFDRVLEHLEGNDSLPAGLTRIVGVEPALDRASTKDPDALLSKPANAEQIEIVRALERHHAVLVQGPPGTGKSHTIANLIGHLVAQGKRVLVTSYTTKALRVLREHLVEELRPLCVALLDNDLEGRTQMEQAVRGIVHRLSTSSEERLLADLRALTDERQKLLLEIERVTEELRAVRQSEYLPIVLANEDVAPADAARFVEREGDRLGWLPGPVALGAPLPITEIELRELYETNDAVSSDEEGDLSTRIPALGDLPSADEIEAAVDLIQSTKRAPSERFWSAVPDLGQTAPLQALGRSIDQLVREIGALAIWQRNLVAAGRSGGAEEQVWRQLGEQVKTAATRWQEARPLLLEHAPAIDIGLPGKEVREALGQIRAHVGAGGSLGGVSMIFRSRWKTILEGCRVNGQAPREAAHFEALECHAEITQTRADLVQRWARQAETAGLPAFETLPDPPEPTLADYVQQFERLLALWSLRWRQISQQLEALGFAWPEFRADEIATATPAAPFEADLAIVTGSLRNAVERRLEAVRRLDALRRLKRASEDLEAFKPATCRALRRALTDLDPHAYRRELGRLEEMWQRVATLKRRRELLQKLGATAPAWAAMIEGRRGAHGSPFAPKDIDDAWKWRQLADELDRRSRLDERALAGRMETQLRQIQEVTVQLVDRKAWLSQLRRTDLEARQALIGWADTQRKIGKGTGKRAPALQLKARELLTRAREAVPVWIMPLARVAESFDPRQGRFDVVIIDEASQCDLTGLLALYLGQEAAIVGDHEQVSPSSIGEAAEDTQALISQFLTGIPNNHLYDGQTSVYDLARQSFGGTIGLREHFRCVPDIIEFSNHLSYQGEIRPLRDPATAPRPHVVEYQVPAALAPERKGKVNEGEARAAAALAAAAMQLPEYEGKTFGVLSLLGDEQAARVQELIQLLVPLEQLERRRFVAGNPAQFQGDERDVAILSMVDVPVQGGLPLQERTTFKQRYNVAASRARDQLWLVHSLDPARDLQPNDLRRRLIEHVRHPEALRRAAEGTRAGSPFEEDVLERLRREGFAAEPQVAVGGYRIDIVVSDGRRQVAIECDGDRLRPPEKIEEDMATQAVLERVGWRFVHVRSTRFCRDPEGTIDWVVKELRRQGVEPKRPAEKLADPSGENLRNKVIRRAWQIMREQEWIQDEAAAPPAKPVDEEAVTNPAAAVAELVLDDTTEPHFVIVEQAEESTVVAEEESTITSRHPS
jgi:very-short-patch-repair endonuclease